MSADAARPAGYKQDRPCIREGRCRRYRTRRPQPEAVPAKRIGGICAHRSTRTSCLPCQTAAFISNSIRTECYPLGTSEVSEKPPDCFLRNYAHIPPSHPERILKGSEENVTHAGAALESA